MDIVFEPESSDPMIQSESESNYRLLFQHMLDGYAYCRMVFDENGKPQDFIYINVNDAFEKHTGLKKETVIGKMVTEVIPDLKEQNPEIIQIYGNAVITGKPIEFETFIKPLEIWLRISVYTPVKDHFVAVFENITQRKLAEEKILLGEFRLRSLVNILQHDSVSTQDFLDHALDEAIKLTASKIGYIYFYNAERQEFVLNTWSKGAMEECTIQEKQTVYQLNKTGIWGEVVRQNKPIVVNDFQAPNHLKKGYPDGHVKLFKFLTVPIHKDDRVVAVAAVANKATDYTETDILQLTLLLDSVWKRVEAKKIEEALIASETRYRRLFETAKDGILILDSLNGKIVDVNPYLIEILGYPKEAFLNKAIWDLGFFKDIVSNKAKFEELQRHRYVHYEDLPLKAAQGQTIDVEFVSNVYEVDRQKVIQCNIRNITERKQAELALQKLNMELEDRVQERTQELQTTNERLIAQIDLVKRAEDELRSLSRRLVEAQEDERRVISMELHDEIGQHLTVLKMMLDTMLRNPEIIKQTDLKRASEQVSNVIAQVRNISMQLHPSMLEVLGLESTLRALFERLHATAGMDIEFRGGVNDAWLDRDTRLGIYRIVQEALTNMMRYSGVKTAQVKLKDCNNHISIFVKDEGKGFDLALLGPGKSAGISGMRERVRTLGGTFIVESALGKGTSISVEIPFSKKSS